MGSSLGALPEGDRTKQLPASKKCTATCGSCPGSQRMKGQCCDPRVALVPVCVCQSLHHLAMLCALLLTFSRHCCSADFVPPSPSPPSPPLLPSSIQPPAVVAVQSTLLATVQRLMCFQISATLVCASVDDFSCHPRRLSREKRRRGITSDTQGKHRRKPGTTTRKNQRATTRGQQPEGNNQRATTRGQQPEGNNQGANLRVL